MANFLEPIEDPELDKLIGRTIHGALWYRRDVFAEPVIMLRLDDGTSVLIGARWGSEETDISITKEN